MSDIVLSTECNCEPTVELNDTDLNIVSAASGSVRTGILNALCARGLAGTYVTTDGRTWYHQCPK